MSSGPQGSGIATAFAVVPFAVHTADIGAFIKNKIYNKNPPFV